MERFRSDLRFAVRTLVRSRMFALATVLALTLGIGANTAIFSVLRGVILRPLPFADADELAMIWTTPIGQTEKESAVGAEFLDWQRDAASFEQISGFFPFMGLDLLSGSRVEQVTAASVTGNFFETLGTKAARGRVFSSRENAASTGRVAVLSDHLWRQIFGDEGSAVGQTLRLSGETYTVIGVMPPAFDFPAGVDLWVQSPHDLPQLNVDMPHERLLRVRYLRAFGRLKPGTSLASARSEMTAIAQHLAAVRPDKNAGRTVNLLSIHEDLVGNIRPALLVLMFMVSFVLLIACVNAASLLLARAVSREREVAVRIALGAKRNDLMRQLLVESLILSLVSGVLGLLVARALLALLVRFKLGDLPRLQEVRIDGPVLLYTLGIALIAGLLFGLLPAIQTFRTQFGSMLRESSNQMAESLRRSRLRGALLALELALAMVLLVGTGLLLRSFIQMQQVDIGFDPQRLLVFHIGLDGKRYPEDFQQSRFFQELVTRMQAQPGVESAAAVLHLPYPGDILGGPLFIEGKPVPPEDQQRSEMRQAVSEGYFKTIGIPVISGRTFGPGDGAEAPLVAVISQAIADRYFPNENPIGRRISQSDPREGEPQWFQIVGVVGNVRHFGPHEEPQPEVYFPFEQWSWGSMDVVVKTSGDPLAMLPAVRRLVSELDVEQPIARSGTMTERISTAMALPRLTLFLVALFGLLATVLAALGVYGLISYSAAQRQNEVGLRMALGAQRGQILLQILSHGLKPVLGGIVLGLAGALAMRHLIERILFQVSASDPMVYLGVAAGGLIVAVLAMLIPAYRTSRVDPLTALRIIG